MRFDCLEQRPYESDSDDDEFEGYLGTDNGPVIMRGIDSAGYEDQESHSSPCRSRSLDFMGQEFESPFTSISPSLSSMHLGTLAAAYSLATHNHLLQLQSLPIPHRQAIF